MKSNITAAIIIFLIPMITQADPLDCNQPTDFATKLLCAAFNSQASKSTQGESSTVSSSQQLVTATGEDLEKAWACNPRIYTVPRAYFSMDDKSCNPNGFYYAKDSYGKHKEGGGWPDVEDSNKQNRIHLSNLLLTTYGVDLSDSNTFKAFDAERERRDGILAQQKVQQREAQELEVQQVKQAKNAADEARARKLRSGEIKILNMEDALLAYPNKEKLLNIAISPLLTPNRAPLTGLVVIDAQEKPGFIRAKATSAIAIYVGASNSSLAYVYLKFTKQSVNYAPDQMRIGGQATVIGRYTENVQYKTVAGELKTAPVIDVMYIKPL